MFHLVLCSQTMPLSQKMTLINCFTVSFIIHFEWSVKWLVSDLHVVLCTIAALFALQVSGLWRRDEVVVLQENNRAREKQSDWVQHFWAEVVRFFNSGCDLFQEVVVLQQNMRSFMFFSNQVLTPQQNNNTRVCFLKQVWKGLFDLKEMISLLVKKMQFNQKSGDLLIFWQIKASSVQIWSALLIISKLRKLQSNLLDFWVAPICCH